MSRPPAKRVAASGFPARFKLMRERLGLGQEQLAEMLSVSQQTISFWESGLRKPARRSWALIQHLLGYTREQLERGHGFVPPESGVFETVMSHPPLHLIPPRAGAEVMRLSTTGLSAEALTLAQAQKALREAVKAGLPVWLVMEGTKR